MTGPSLRQSTGADGRGRDYLRDLYAEQFATHPEYKPTGWERKAGRDRVRWIEEAELDQTATDNDDEGAA